MTVSAQRWVRTPVLLLASLLNTTQANSAEAKAANQPARVAKLIETPPVVLREPRLEALAQLSRSNKFERIATWFQELHPDKLNELKSFTDRNSLKEALIFAHYPDVVDEETSNALLKFFRELETQKVMGKLQALHNNDLKEFQNLQKLAETALKTKSRDANRKLIQALKKAGIEVEESGLNALFIVICIAIVAVGAALTGKAFLDRKPVSRSKRVSIGNKPVDKKLPDPVMELARAKAKQARPLSAEPVDLDDDPETAAARRQAAKRRTS
jgi:hypothetical protein